MRRSEGTSDAKDAEASYGKATRAELSRQFNQAFQHYIKAAELFLHLSRSAGSNEKDRVKWKSSAQKALERAEKIKSFTEKSVKSPGPSSERIHMGLDSPPDVRLAPVAINHFAPHEIYRVLKKGGYVNGLSFPLWDESPSGDAPQGDPYEDPDGQPSLSPEQSALSAVWKRPQLQSTADAEPRQILPHDILQQVITDCSVCASISVCLEHSRRFGTNIAETPLHHYCDPGQPSGSQSGSKLYWNERHGRVDFKFLFNGAWRRVVVDDKLPYDPQKGTLMCMSALSPVPSRSRLWPSLLEKAYMKLMGGYDFPGSNSAIDLHAIAGFIPEHVEIRRSDFERERTWERLSSGFHTGRCMVTLGTGHNPSSVDEDIKLLPSHSYAVTDVSEGEGGRTITILDSWVCPLTKEEEGSRTLTIPWADALNLFEGIYLSWDPAIWQHNLEFHGMWRRNDPEDVYKQLYLTFTNGSSVEEEVWVLLTRHTTETRRTQDFIALQVQVEDDMQPSPPRQSLSVKETYTNSNHVLLRTRLSSAERAGILSILSSYDGDANEMGFTISVYSSEHVDIKWNETVVSPPYTTKVSGTITHKTAGGNCTLRTFMVNPQYHLRILSPSSSVGGRTTAKARTQLSLHSSKDTPVNVSISWSQGKRVAQLSEQDLIATSGPYTYGSARVSKDMIPGDSTIVVSAFHTQYLGPFTLKVECTLPFDLIPIPQEGAGMYNKTIRGSWERHTAGGNGSLPSFSKNPKYELDAPVLTECIVRLQMINASTTLRLNIAIYPAPASSTSDLSRLTQVASSGVYDDALAGVVIPQTKLRPGKYWLVPSTHKPGVEAEFGLICYFSAANVRIAERV